jgi:hypothetical protein
MVLRPNPHMKTAAAILSQQMAEEAQAIDSSNGLQRSEQTTPTESKGTPPTDPAPGSQQSDPLLEKYANDGQTTDRKGASGKVGGKAA